MLCQSLRACMCIMSIGEEVPPNNPIGLRKAVVVNVNGMTGQRNTMNTESVGNLFGLF